MRREEVEQLGVSTDLPTACEALGISRSAGYQAVHRGTFPVRILRVGSRIVVPTKGLREVLGLEEGRKS